MDAMANKHVVNQKAERKHQALLWKKNLIREPKFYRTVTGFAQTKEEAKVVQVSSCPPGLLGQWWPGTGLFRLQSMEQSLIKTEYPR